jgi:hypothetical protein
VFNVGVISLGPQAGGVPEWVNIADLPSFTYSVVEGSVTSLAGGVFDVDIANEATYSGKSAFLATFDASGPPASKEFTGSYRITVISNTFTYDTYGDAGGGAELIVGGTGEVVYTGGPSGNTAINLAPFAVMEDLPNAAGNSATFRMEAEVV